MATGRRTVTYLARQDGLEGKWLRAVDHAALLDDGCCVDEKASWTERMLSRRVFRDLVTNVVFMKRGPQSALMEFFPVTAHVLKNAV
ncbi:hypothetical protein EDB83DRAFT_2441103 [Lactarius deliciosus]|nr:hypothetical protein EDB83DRAFT_2441103 [Lactarius deliciosus]